MNRTQRQIQHVMTVSSIRRRERARRTRQARIKLAADIVFGATVTGLWFYVILLAMGVMAS